MNGQTSKVIMQIFWSFFKIGPVTFGGGYAMIPFIEREVVTKRKWVKSEEISDTFALAESVPGAIAINSATFIGHKIAGVRGAIAAMLGVLLPTFFIVIGLAILFLQLKGNPWMESAFIGIRAAIVALITYAAIQIGRISIIDKTTVAIVIGAVALLLFTPVHPVFIIIGGAGLGVLLVNIKKKIKKKNKQDGAQ